MRVTLPVPGDLCRECGLCCRFSDPLLLTPWAVRVREEGALPALFTPPRPIHLIEGKGRMDLPVWICSGLDQDRYRCSFWGEHPADCRLYPLVLIRRTGVFMLALDPDCPFASRVPFSFFTEWAGRFRDQEWSALSGDDLGRIGSLADHEDRPQYLPVLDLPLPVPPVP